MLRGFDYGLLAMLGVALVYGVAWAVVALTLGLLAIGLGGGWLIGVAIREGVARAARARATTDAAEVAADTAGATGDEAPVRYARRGMSTLGALLGGAAWIVGSYVSFAIVQLGSQGTGLLDPGKFAEHMNSTLAVEPTLLQPAVLAAFVVMGWIGARPKLPKLPKPPKPPKPAAAKR